MIIGFSGTVLSRAGEPEPGVFGSLEPEPLEKKTGAGPAWNKKSQEPEDIKHTEIVLLLLFFR